MFNNNRYRLYSYVIFSVLVLMNSVANAAECLPDLGNGNICTAKDFQLTEVVLPGAPANCTEGTIVPAFTVRMGITPTANERYDIGFFVGENGEPAINGSSCTFASLAPIEVGGNFDGTSGSGPYRDLDGNSCGDSLKHDGEIFKDILLTNILCQDADNNGQLDVDYALTWQQQVQNCSDPSIPSNFYPPSSSKCKAAIGNVDIPVIPPVPVPLIRVTKSVSPKILFAPGGEVIYSLTMSNIGTEFVTLTALNDNIFGDVNGRGNCSVPQIIVQKASYQCSFPITLSAQVAEVYCS